jgi:hypothetical protein
VKPRPVLYSSAMSTTVLPFYVPAVIKTMVHIASSPFLYYVGPNGRLRPK